MKKLTLSLLALVSIALVSCDKDDDNTTTTSLPSTYNFKNVSHSGQDQRLDMLSEVSSYVKSTNDGSAINETQLINMLTNQNYTWANADLNSSTKQIADKMDSEGGIAIGAWIKSLAQLSQNPASGSNGTAGLVMSNAGTKQYLFNEKGVELAQLIEKGSMGALSFYQATTVYFGSGKMDVDNETVEPGDGTEMQHHWDEAFGYWGVPNDFGSAGFVYDESADYDRFWAKYTNELNSVLNTNSMMMQGFIKGRNAINTKDYTTRNQSIEDLRNTWEKISAAMAIHYLNGGKADFADDALRNHQLSEAIAFLWNVRFSPNQKLTDVEIDDLISQNLDNLYDVTVADINTVIDKLATTYGLNDVKDQL